MAHDWVALKLKGSPKAHLKEMKILKAFLKPLMKATLKALL